MSKWPLVLCSVVSGVVLGAAIEKTWCRTEEVRKQRAAPSALVCPATPVQVLNADDKPPGAESRPGEMQRIAFAKGYALPGFLICLETSWGGDDCRPRVQKQTDGGWELTR